MAGIPSRVNGYFRANGIDVSTNIYDTSTVIDGQIKCVNLSCDTQTIDTVSCRNLNVSGVASIENAVIPGNIDGDFNARGNAITFTGTKTDFQAIAVHGIGKAQSLEVRDNIRLPRASDNVTPTIELIASSGNIITPGVINVRADRSIIDNPGTVRCTTVIGEENVQTPYVSTDTIEGRVYCDFNKVTSKPNVTITISDAQLRSIANGSPGIEIIPSLGNGKMPILRSIQAVYHRTSPNHFSVPGNDFTLNFAYGIFEENAAFNTYPVWTNCQFQAYGFLDQSFSMYVASNNVSAVNDVGTIGVYGEPVKLSYLDTNSEPGVSLIFGSGTTSHLTGGNGCSMTITVWYDILDLNRTS